MDSIVVGIAILAWIVSIIANAAKAMKKSSSTPPLPLAPPQTARGRTAQPQLTNLGRTSAQRPVSQSPGQRILPRQTPGSSPNNPLYNDQAAERRFAQEVDQLIRSEPRPTTDNTVTSAKSAPLDLNEQVQNRLGRIIIDRPALLTGIVLAEVLGPPKSKQLKNRG